MKMKRIMGLLLALVMFMGCLPLSTIETYAAEGDVAIDEAHFPDKIFRNYVKANFDENGDGNLSQVERDYVEVIDVHYGNIGNLKGIEYFKNITYLSCFGNKLEKLDVSKNTKLAILYCFENNLTSLVVGENPNLIHLNCNRNNLTSLDLSNNINLTYLHCNENDLTELNVDKNTNLRELWCNGNNLTSLDVKENANLTELNCDSNELASLKLSKNLTTLSCFRNKLEKLDLSNSTELTVLECSKNNLTSLDVSKNTKLYELNCSINKLTSLDVSKNTKLYKLGCWENKLTNLDVTKNTNLLELDARKNPLVSIKLVKKEDLTSSTYSRGIHLTPAQYTIKVKKGSKKVPFDKLPQGFDKNRIIKSDVTLEEDGFTWDGSTNPIKYRYKFCENLNEVERPEIADAGAEITVEEIEFDPDHVVSMEVITQPKKLSYTEGEKLDLSGLVVRLTDKQGLTKDIAFKDFEANEITTNPKNGADLTSADDNQPVIISKGSLQDETNKLTVNKKVFDPEHVESRVVKEQPKLIYTEGEKLDLSGLVVTLKDNQDLEKDVAFKDFEANEIKAKPANDTALTLENNEKKVTLTKGNLTAETEALTVNEKVFDPEHVESMVVKTQPKLIYTEGEKLDLSKLVVTLTDKQGLTKDVEFKDFEENNITAQPENDTKLTVADSGKKVTLTKENSTEETEALTKDVAFRDFASNVITTNLIDDTALTLANNGKALKLTKGDPITAETEALTVKEKPTPPPTPTPDPPVVGPVDPTPNDPPVVGPVDPTPNDPPVVGPVDPQDPNGEKPADTSKYYTVTFKADPAKGTIDAKNTFYVLKNSGKTLADLANDAPKVIAKPRFKFTGWEPTLDANTTINKDMTVNAKFEKVTPTPTDPPVNPTQPGVKSQVANNKALPKTASSINIELYTIFMILSGTLLVVAFKRKKESQ